ncbi:MAG TPA: GNAT family N-acetyltransferase [Bacteroidia bacterium]|nr:GNAT family N-acetyltransferase [Bacteroidia bacterium]
MSSLESPRLLLRAFESGDASNLYRMDALPEVHTYLGNKPMQSIQEAEQVIGFIQAQYRSNGIGRWAAIEKSSGHFIGWAGLKYITEAENNRVNFYDLGFRLHPHFWGKGYATEAGKISLAYAFNTLQTEEVIGTCHEQNLASRKALEKCGLRFREKFIYNGELPCDWLSISNAEWLNLQVK